MELDLFEPPPEDLYTGIQEGPPPLRDYQQAAVAAVRKELESNRGTLVLLATGLGKTQIACELIRTDPGRCCFIAHRSELIQQAARRIEQFSGVVPHIEKAEHWAGAYGSIPVVASIQTLSRERRISRFDPDEFSLIVIDEVHHATSETYRAVIEYFSGAKIVGLTATPDRLDGAALGQILDSVAYRYELNDAIADGWLAPIKMRMVQVDGIDWSNVGTVAGDFNQGQLDEIMAREESLHGIAKPTVELAGDRPTIVFTTSIDNAHRLSEVINRYAGRDAAVPVDSKLKGGLREENLRLFETGQRQFLVNVGIATEGYDHPPTSCIVMGRPTKSRALFVQMLGRGTRGGEKFPIDGKNDLLVLDFVGQSNQHDTITAVDALSGDISDEQARLIKAEVQKSGREMTIDEAMEKAAENAKRRKEAEDYMRAKRAGLKADVHYSDFDANPYVALSVRRDYLHEKYGYAAATDKQMAYLIKKAGKYAQHLPGNLGKLEASRLIGKMEDRRKRGLCTFAQMMTLRKFQPGLDAEKATFKGASRILDAIAKNRWKPIELDRALRLAVSE